MKTYFSTIEPLESRIAPASVTHMTDANGDIITFTSSLGNLPGLVTSSGPLPGGQHDQFSVNLTSSAFNGTNLSVTVTKGPHGDGRLANLFVDASGNDLGNVSIAGDLGSITAGTGTGTIPAIKSLTVESIGLFESEIGTVETSAISGSISKLTIKGDMDGTFLDVSQNIGSIFIGGSLIGGTGNLSTDGDIFAGAAIGNVSIRHDVRGGEAVYNGIIASTTTLGAVTVGGSVYGGQGSFSGTIGGGTNVASVAIGGSVIGGMGDGSGVIYGGYHGDGTVGKVTIGGSVIGGDGAGSGAIGYLDDGAFNDSLTTVVIGKDLIGGGGELSGGVDAHGGSLGSLTVNGSLLGGTNTSGPTGFIAAAGTTGTISIRGSLYGTGGYESASIELTSGVSHLSIGGSIYGGDQGYSGYIDAGGSGILTLNIHGNVIGGGGPEAGSVQASTITTETIGGVVIPGVGGGSGVVPPA